MQLLGPILCKAYAWVICKRDYNHPEDSCVVCAPERASSSIQPDPRVQKYGTVASLPPSSLEKRPVSVRLQPSPRQVSALLQYKLLADVIHGKEGLNSNDKYHVLGTHCILTVQ